MLEKILPKKKELAPGAEERGLKQLSRLATVMDILFAMAVFKLFTFLPNPDLDHFDSSTINNLFSAYSVNFLVIVVGIVLVLMYWNLSNQQTGNLIRTDSFHASLSILHVLCLLMYLYFIRLDIQLDGQRLALQMESIFLALAGFLSVYAYLYAKDRGFISDQIPKEQQRKMTFKFLTEPITAALTFPFAVFGPDIWTLAWLLMVPVGFILGKIRDRGQKSTESTP